MKINSLGISLVFFSGLMATSALAVTDTTGTAFRGSCSTRGDDVNGTSLEIGNFNLEIKNKNEDCPAQTLSLKGFDPGATGNDIYVEYQGSNASPKIFMNESLFGHNAIHLHDVKVGFNFFVMLTTKIGRPVVCTGEVVDIKAPTP